MTKLEEVAGGFLLIMEYGRSKQLRGFGLMPLHKVALVEPDIVYCVGKPPGVERPRPQIAHGLRFYLLDNLLPLFGQIAAQILGAEC